MPYVILLLFAVVCWMACAPARAQDGRWAWSVDIGAGVMTSPVFEGSERLKTSPLPYVSIRRRGEERLVGMHGDGLGLAVVDFRQDDWRIRGGPVVALQSGRREADARQLHGLGNIDRTIEAGAFLEIWLQSFLRLRAEMRRGVVGGHDDWNGFVGAAVIVRPVTGLVVAAGPKIVASDSSYAQRYFGVDAAQSARSGMPIYTPGGGWRSALVEATVHYDLSDIWSIHAFAELGRLVGDVADAPLVGERGDAMQGRVGVALVYSFSFDFGPALTKFPNMNDR